MSLYASPCAMSAQLHAHLVDSDRIYERDDFIEQLVEDHRDELALRLMRTTGWVPVLFVEEPDAGDDVRDALLIAIDGDETEAGRRLLRSIKARALTAAEAMLREEGSDYINKMPRRITADNAPDPVTAKSISLREYEV